MRLIDADKLKSALLLHIDTLKKEAKELESLMAADLVVGLGNQEEGIRNALEIIDNQPTVNEWIPCSERLPDINERVLVCKQKGEPIRIGYRLYVEDDEWMWWLHKEVGDKDHFYEIEDITAWMPLPEPYKGSEE